MEIPKEIVGQRQTMLDADGQHNGSTSARDRRTLLYMLSLVLDIGAVILGYLCALELRSEQWLAAGGHSIVIIMLPIFVMMEIARSAQCVETLQHRLLAIQRSLGALLVTGVVVVGLIFLLKLDDISRLGLIITFASAAFFIVLSKVLMDFLVKRVLGESVVATILILDGLEAQPDGPAHVINVADVGLWPDLNTPSMIDTLSRMISPYDRVVVACIFEHRASWATFLKGHDVGGEILLDRDLLHGAVAIGTYDQSDTIILSRGPLGLMSRIQKRSLDLVVASLATVFLLPLLILVAVAIKLDSPGPIFFRQVRVGQGNRQFRIFKFRSMRCETADEEGNRSTDRADDRVTKVGYWIRRTSIDELPQLLNVLRGEMSVVGPRPHALGSMAGNALFWHASRQYWLRHALKPGITGLAQIRGYRGATNKVEDLEGRVRCDLEYLATWSLWTDIMILLKTARVVVHKNAY